MTTLTPRRDALMAACAEARSVIASLPPSQAAAEAISRQIGPDVMEAALIPIVEAMDFGLEEAAAIALLANAFASSVASFSLSSAGGDRDLAHFYALRTLNALIDFTKSTIDQPSSVEIIRRFNDAVPGARQ